MSMIIMKIHDDRRATGPINIARQGYDTIIDTYRPRQIL